MLGLIETVIFYIPVLNWYLYGIIAEIIAVGLTSLVVKEFNVDWQEGFGSLVMGAAMIICTRVILSFVSNLGYGYPCPTICLLSIFKVTYLGVALKKFSDTAF